MNIGRQRILSMVFLIAALVMFGAMHFLPLGGGMGWEMWPGTWGVIVNPVNFREASNAVGASSFFTFSLLIVASPFLGNVWVKSLLAWSMAVVFSGLAAAGFWIILFRGFNYIGGIPWGFWCLLISPVFNFIGLLLARPQWLKKPGLGDLP